MRSIKRPPKSVEVQWEMVKSQSNTWLFPFLCGVIIVSTLLLVLIPQMNRIFEVRNELETQKVKLGKLTAKQAFLEGLQETELNEQIQLAEQVLPNKKPLDVVVSAVGDEFKVLGLQLKTYSVNPGGMSTPSAEILDYQPGTLLFMPIKIEASGTKESVFALLSRLKTLTPLSAIRNVSVALSPLETLKEMQSTDSFGTIEDITINESEIETNQITADLMIYYAMPPDVMGKITDELPPQIQDMEQTIAQIKTMLPYTKTAVEVPLELENQRGDLFNF